MTAHWASDAVFYHVYPLGLCGAPPVNDHAAGVVPRLACLYDWIDHWRALGVTALYLGPVFESGTHGYDTTDYFRVDRRLGDAALLRDLVAALHRAGIRVVLDGVFNHVGRHFWAFRDVLERGPASPYRDWFAGLDFGRRSPLGDPFTYRCWRGHYELVKLNLAHPGVQAHLLGAVTAWIEAFDIDGLRLDTANLLRAAFLRRLAKTARAHKPDFWLLGEVVGGDYGKYRQRGLQAVTNYQAHGALVDSHNRRDYGPLAHTLGWQAWHYREIGLYNFADNHDVNRIASRLQHKAHLYPLFVLLFTLPGIPSVYYGSEWGVSGRRKRHSDAPLRPAMPRPGIGRRPHPDLAGTIARLAWLRRELPALRHGDYQEVYVQGEHFAFARRLPGQEVVVVLNAGSSPAPMRLWLPHLRDRWLQDALNPGEGFTVEGEHVTVDPVPPCWGRILVAQGDAHGQSR